MFGRDTVQPFDGSSIGERATKAWRRAELVPDNAPRVSAHVREPDDRGRREREGALDRYGHLMPGNEEQAAELLDAYLGYTLPPVQQLVSV